MMNATEANGGARVAEAPWSDDSLRMIGLAATKLNPSRVRAATTGLSYRERSVLGKRFGATGPPETYRVIAEHHHVSVERVRQIENQALKKICAMLAGGGLTPRRSSGPLLVEELELPVRVYNCLKRYGINRVDELTEVTREEIATLPNFGKTSMDELEACLAARGLKFANSSRLDARVLALESEVRRLWAIVEARP